MFIVMCLGSNDYGLWCFAHDLGVRVAGVVILVLCFVVFDYGLGLRVASCGLRANVVWFSVY